MSNFENNLNEPTPLPENYPEGDSEKQAELLESLSTYGKNIYTCLNLTTSESEVDDKLKSLYKNLRKGFIEIDLKKYSIQKFDKDRGMPSELEFAKSIRTHLASKERNREIAASEERINDVRIHSDSIDKLKAISNGFALKAFEDDNLSTATRMWIISGEYDKHPIIGKIIEDELKNPQTSENQKRMTKDIIKRYQEGKKFF